MFNFHYSVIPQVRDYDLLEGSVKILVIGFEGYYIEKNDTRLFDNRASTIV